METTHEERTSLSQVEQQAKAAIDIFDSTQSRFYAGGDLWIRNDPTGHQGMIEYLTQPAQDVLEAVSKLILEGGDSKGLLPVNSIEPRIQGEELTFDGVAAVLGRFQVNCPKFWKLVAQRVATLSREG